MHQYTLGKFAARSLSTIFSTSVSTVLLVVMLPVTAPSLCGAEDISWVGYQYGPPGGGVPNFSNDASFFDGNQWLNYHVPMSEDAAIFDETFDPQSNGMPHNVLFGDFIMPVVPIYNPSSYPIPGGDATVRELVMRNGEFDFYFRDQLGTPQGSLRVAHRMIVADVDNSSATLTVRDGTLTTDFAVHLAPGTGSQGAVIVDGPGAKWIHNFAADVGWVGEGSITIRNGGVMESQLELGAGIRNGAVGRIDVLSGSTLTLFEKGLDIGSGKEASGNARGIMRVLGEGSHASAPWLRVGSYTAVGSVLIAEGGTAEILGATQIFAESEHESELRVTGASSSLAMSGELILGGRNSTATFIVEDGATASASYISMNYDQPVPGEARIVARSGGVLTIASVASLYDNGNSVLDVSDDGRIEIGTVDAPAEPGEIRVGAGGWLRGSGTILGDLTVEADGVFEPGFSPGIFNIAGDLTFLDERSLTLEIGGTAPGAFDQINVTGDFSFGGTLFVSFINGFVPSNLDSFDLITVGGESLREFNIHFQNIAPGLVSAQYVDGAYRVTAVPEPSTFALAGIGILIGVAYRRRRGGRA